MRNRFSMLALLAATAALAISVNAEALPKLPPGNSARFVALRPHVVPGVRLVPSKKTLVQWNGSFTDLTNKKITYTMAGTDPAATNATTTFTVYIIPIKMVYGASNGNMTFDPLAKLKSPKKKNVIQSLLASPIFDNGVDFNQGGTDLGQTQYIDAFQRGNFWKSVQTNTNYHVLLNPVVLDEVTINVTPSQGSVHNNSFAAGKVGEMDINAFDAKLQGFMAALKKVNPSVLPLFISKDIFLTSGGCCIGGYHSANNRQPGGQTYGYSTYVDATGSFSQDVSAISHEIGEWMADPFVDNHVNCHDNTGGYLEVGDPLEGMANYGGFHYPLNGFTYNLQSLIFMGYWGAPIDTSANSWYSFQNDMSHVCPGQ